MNLFFSKPFIKKYRKLPKRIQEKADEQITLMIINPQHPSLGLKKMKGQGDIWEGRITDDYRFTFHIDKDIYIMRKIGTHDILKNP